ncbi:MAG: threonine--tRNA ligase [Alphaproteobacteria bacterium]|nr:threonine--tRNA ligase [Alphaproteobacteria bacterium]
MEQQAEDFDLEARELSPVETLRHSAAHLLASAVARLYPGTRFAIGPHIEHGFYYDMDVAGTISEDDLSRIEDEMRTIAKGNHPFVRTHMNRADALAWAEQQGQVYKAELIAGFDTDTVGFYTHGNFTDMCAGPHVRYSSKLKHFKLTKVAGAYWRGDEKRPMLTRVYGVAFETKEELEKHLHFLEEAKKRDHRRLGKELDLFLFHEWAPGAAFWLPHGEHIYSTLSERMRKLLAGEGYSVVRTPLIFDSQLFQTSGHWQHYRDDMFHFPESHHGDKEERLEAQEAHEQRWYGVKPMNCPSHMLIYRSRKRSYRELPLRLHDQGVLHRNERSGALGGLVRVRQFSQDDAHIFCMEDQIADEVAGVLSLVDRIYSAFGMGFELHLSTRPVDKLGDDALWDQAENALREALDRTGRPYGIKEGDGAFYGPKIDFDVLDALERRHQCATIQLDFQLPRRFELTYAGADNQLHVPVVIHRAVMGSFERFIGILIEHFAGAFPVWLAPEQVRVLTVSERTNDYGRDVTDRLRAAGIRATHDDGDDKIGYKIRVTHGKKVPYMAVIGVREAEEGTVSIRSRDHGDLGSLALEDFIARVQGESDIPF